MKKSNLRATAALQALALLGAGTTAAFIAAPAAAQDYTSGAITGSVTDEAGNAVSGATVTLTSKAQGFTRTSTTSSAGNFTFSGLPSGDYNIAVEAAGNAGFTATDVTVLAGQSASLGIQLSSSQEIVVTGAQIQAFEGTTTGINVDVEELTKTVPVGRNLTSVVLLAPGTSRGDSVFGNLASVGGASVAENAYYVNGLNTTNFDNYLGSAQVPFDFYKSVEVKSGGYPAEFGRATGGIVNAVTKAGTNDFKAALHLNWAPDFLQAHGRDLQTCSNITAPNASLGGINTVIDTRCANLTNRAADSSHSLSAIAELGGPIFRDRLFAYGLLELRRNESITVNRNSGTATRYRYSDPFWGVKLDAYPIDDHHLEFTIFDTRQSQTRDDLAYSTSPSNEAVFGNPQNSFSINAGGISYVGKYTGRFTDWLTLSAAYGKMKDRFDALGAGAAAAFPYVNNASGTTVFGVANGGFYNGQRAANEAFPYSTERKFYRADADVYVDFFGDHHFRFGFDTEKNLLTETTRANGGAYLNGVGYINPAALSFGTGGTGLYFQFQAPRGTQNIVDVTFYNSGGSFTAKNDAIYLQDEWKPTDRLTLNLGIRRDNFLVNRADGEAFAKLKDNWAPRIGLTYDVWPDKRGQIKAFYGQYYLPFASNTAYRQAGSEFYFTERFFTSGVGANGVPILTGVVTDEAEFVDACPFRPTTFAFDAGNYCNVTGDGTVPATDNAIAANLKATKQQEFLLGYEHKLGRWKLGVNYTRRKLLMTAEDMAIDAAILDYCDSEGIEGCSLIFSGFHQYVIANPGEDLTVRLRGDDLCTVGVTDDNGTAANTADDIFYDADPRACEVVTFAGDSLGYPKAKRTYSAVEFTVERPYDGVWTVGGNYTWSKSKGNSEGFVQSDYGQDDAGITIDFDQPGFTDYSYGYLPNDRRHRLKLWGSYTFDDRFTVGSNFSLESPRSLSCFGRHPTDVFALAYGTRSHFCGGEPAPRGQGNKTDWVKQLDMKFAYKVNIPTGQTLTMRADIFNVLNLKAVQKRSETGEAGRTPIPGTTPTEYYYVPSANYGIPTLYQSPRSIRLGLDIEF